jgi:hypothetical protein
MMECNNHIAFGTVRSAEGLFGWSGNFASGTLSIYGRLDEDPAALPLS